MPTLASFVDMPPDERRTFGLEFTPREIAQQPDTWVGTYSIFKEHQARICGFLEQAGVRAAPESRPVVMLVGAGTSDYIGLSLALLLRERWGCEVFACASTDLLMNMEEYVVPGRPYLWISFSRSGNSPEGVAVLEQAIERCPTVSHLVVTCNANARMIALAEHRANACVILLDDAVNDRSLAMTSSFTNMVVVGHCLAHAWSLGEYQLLLDQLTRCGRELLVSAAAEAERIAASGLAGACFVGSGALYGVAKESALKVLEMTAGTMRTMSETVLGLRHGPMAALNSRIALVCFASSDERRQRFARDLMQEVTEKQITGMRIVVGPATARTAFSAVCDTYLPIAGEISDAYRPVLDTLFGQLLGLYSSIAHELKPDAPSPGGVINRVVQEFHIY